MTDSAKPIKKPGPDRSKPIAHTPPTHTTPAECSLHGEGTSEPVAWWLKGSEYDTGCEYEYVSLLKENAEAAAAEGGTVAPLYRQPQPTLTDAEREAVEWAAWKAKALRGHSGNFADSLLGLLERHRATTRAETMADDRWIPVTERMPQFDEDVLVSSDSGFHVCAYRRGDGLCAGSFEREDMKVIEDVTHWMPLPEPPTGGDLSTTSGGAAQNKTDGDVE